MLPITAAVQKELLPVLERPVIDYVVADCIAAGATNIIFVIRPGSRSLQDYYVGNPSLESHLKRFKKVKALEKLEALHDSATFSFIEQPDGAGYGTAVPLVVAIPHLPKDDAVLVCAGDAFTWNTDGTSDMAGMVKMFVESNADGAIMGLELPDEELHKYGVLGVDKRDGIEYLTEFVEKPAPGTAPSNLANSALYIMTPGLMKYVLAVKPNQTNGEYYLTDALIAAAKDRQIAIHRATGEWLDAGNIDGWLHANMTVAKARPELRPLN